MAASCGDYDKKLEDTNHGDNTSDHKHTDSKNESDRDEEKNITTNKGSSDNNLEQESSESTTLSDISSEQMDASNGNGEKTPEDRERELSSDAIQQRNKISTFSRNPNLANIYIPREGTRLRLALRGR